MNPIGATELYQLLSPRLAKERILTDPRDDLSGCFDGPLQISTVFSSCGKHPLVHQFGLELRVS